MFGGEGGKTRNTQLELKFCHQMCLMRKRFSPGQIRKRKEKNTQELETDINASFKSRWLWNSVMSTFKCTTWVCCRPKAV